MLYYSKSDILIRNMNNSDVPLIVDSKIEQGVSISAEKCVCRLKDQDKGKNIALIAKYKGVIAGCVNVYLYSHNGSFGGQGYSEIVDLIVFEKYKNLDIETKLMDVAEKIASEYSDTVYLSVALHNGKDLYMYLERGYISDGSGVWYKNQICPRDADCKNNEELVLWLYKKLIMTNIYKFPVTNTPEHPFFQWWEDGTKMIDGRVNNEKFQRVAVGDEITLIDTKNNDFIKGIVISKHEYITFEEMIRTEGVKNIFPSFNDDDIERGVQVYKEFSGWELVEKYGCVAFGIKIIESKI